MKILFDPGHGGSDRANRGPTKYIEADGNLMFCKSIQKYLDCDLTRDTDKTLSLTDRGRMAKGYDLFISVHSDAFNSTTSGVTTFDSVDLKNEVLARKIGQACADAMGIPFRGAREKESKNNKGEDYYTVIDVAQDVGCPNVILIERGFHSNPNEEKILLDPVAIDRSAKAVADVIKDYFKLNKPVIVQSIDLKSKGIAAIKSLAKMGRLSDTELWEGYIVSGKLTNLEWLFIKWEEDAKK